MAGTSMYNYYPSKEALLVAYTDSEMEHFVDELRNDIGAEEAVHTFTHATAVFVDLAATRAVTG